MMVMFVIAQVRLGSEEEHKEWDAREELRSKLEKEVMEVLREEDDDEFIFTLLCDNEVIEALRGREMGKLATLIKEKRETCLLLDLDEAERREMLNILKAVAKNFLGKNHGISDAQLNLLLKDKNILEATKAYKVSRENNDPAAKLTTWHNLLMLFGKAR